MLNHSPDSYLQHINVWQYALFKKGTLVYKQLYMIQVTALNALLYLNVCIVTL